MNSIKAKLLFIFVALGGMIPFNLYMGGEFDNPSPMLFQDLEKFKLSDGGECVQRYFKGVKNMNGGDEIGDNKKIDSDYFEISEKQEYSSCLMVNWNAPKYDNNKSRGHGELVGTGLIGSSKGFVIFSKLSNPKDAVNVSGEAYTLRKENNKSGHGIIDGRMKIQNEKILSKDDFSNKFPKKGDGLRSYKRLDEYWNLPKNSNDWCVEGEGCEKNAHRFNYLRGVGSGSKNSKYSEDKKQKFVGGSSNFNVWGNEFFGKDHWDMGVIFDSVEGYGNPEKTINKGIITYRVFWYREKDFGVK